MADEDLPAIHAALRVFLCHSSTDKPAVRQLYAQLLEDGFDPWLDEEALLPGQRWEPAIKEAVRTADAVLVCLSNESVTKEGFVQQEIGFALDVADTIPEEAIFIIPVRLEVCPLPSRLSGWHSVDQFTQQGYPRLRKALLARSAALGISLHDFRVSSICRFCGSSKLAAESFGFPCKRQ